MMLAGHDYDDKRLVRQVLRNMNPVVGKKYGCWMWVKVMRVFGVGSTVAHALCAEFGFDPEQKVRK